MRKLVPYLISIYISSIAVAQPQHSIEIPEDTYVNARYFSTLTPQANQKTSEENMRSSKKRRILQISAVTIGTFALGLTAWAAITPNQPHFVETSPDYDEQFKGPALEIEPQNIFAEDNRVVERSGDYPFSAIGRLTFEDASGQGYHCTGSLVTDDSVITAAHCVEDSFGKRYRNFFFSAGAISGTSNSRATSRAVRIFSDSRYGSPTGESDITYDWAVIKLEKPLGQTQGTLGLKKLGDMEGNVINLAGYSGDLQGGLTPSVHANCLVQDDEFDGSYAHDCDMTGGSSGSGVSTQDFRYIFSINSHNFCNGDCDVDAWSRYTPGARNVAVRIDEALRLLNSERGRSATSSIEPQCIDLPLLSSTATGVNRVNCSDFNQGLGVDLPGTLPPKDGGPRSSATHHNIAYSVVLAAVGVCVLYI